MGEQQLDIEQPKSFTGSISGFEDKLPQSFIDSLDSEPRSYAKEDAPDGMKKSYIVAQEGENIVGFAICFLPNNPESEDEVMFHYRYVDKTNRKRGIGKKLRESMYSSCLEAGYTRVTSGINNVIRINDEGLPVRNFSGEGGYGSYLSMTRPSSTLAVSHRIIFVCINPDGLVDLTFETILDPQNPELMPDSPEQLLEKVMEHIPSGIDAKDLAPEGSFDSYKDGKKLSISEFMRLMRS